MVWALRKLVSVQDTEQLRAKDQTVDRSRLEGYPECSGASGNPSLLWSSLAPQSQGWVDRSVASAQAALQEYVDKCVY